jgi:hypothetical protein
MNGLYANRVEFPVVDGEVADEESEAPPTTDAAPRRTVQHGTVRVVSAGTMQGNPPVLLAHPGRTSQVGGHVITGSKWPDLGRCRIYWISSLHTLIMWEVGWWE